MGQTKDKIYAALVKGATDGLRGDALYDSVASFPVFGVVAKLLPSAMTLASDFRNVAKFRIYATTLVSRLPLLCRERLGGVPD